MNTRRQFLLNCSTLAAAALTTPLHAAGGFFKVRLGDASVDELSFQDFAGHLNTPFRVRTASGSAVELKLIKATWDRQTRQHGRRPALDADYEKFSLVFSGPCQEPLPQEIYPFEHAELGRFDLFIVPVFTQDPQMTKYAAVFNRPRPV